MNERFRNMNTMINTNIKGLPPFVGSIGFIILIVGVVAIVITSIIALIRYNTCSPHPGYYEPFEDTGLSKSISDMRARIQHIQGIKDSLSTTMEEVNDAADDTCDILKQIEDSYVSSGSAPSDETEYSLPQATQDKRMAERKKRAEKRFTTEESVFKSVSKRQLLECFANNDQAEETKDLTDEAAATQQELTDELSELQTLIDNAEIQAAVNKIDQINARLMFNAPYINKGLKSVTEGFDDDQPITPDALIAKADVAIAKALAVREQLTAVKDAVEKQKYVSRLLNQKRENLQNGNVDESDLARIQSGSDKKIASDMAAKKAIKEKFKNY
jgi:hypothetical protein